MTIEKVNAQKVRTAKGDVRYIIGGSWYKIPMNGKMKYTYSTKIEKIYGDVTIEIENDEIYGKRAVSVVLA